MSKYPDWWTEDDIRSHERFCKEQGEYEAMMAEIEAEMDREEKRHLPTFRWDPEADVR